VLVKSAHHREAVLHHLVWDFLLGTIMWSSAVVASSPRAANNTGPLLGENEAGVYEYGFVYWVCGTIIYLC
jgi:hypothetical protein